MYRSGPLASEDDVLTYYSRRAAYIHHELTTCHLLQAHEDDLARGGAARGACRAGGDTRCARPRAERARGGA